MRSIYNQKNTTLLLAGVPIQDFAEGTVITVTRDGGEVQKTQGTDGAGINIATRQGATVTFTLRETSRSRALVNSIALAQYNGGPGVPLIIRTGADVIHSLTEAYISQEGELTTGDKMQGGIQYTATATNDDVSNIDLISLL